MTAEEAARITMRNEDNFNPHLFVEKIILKAVVSAAMVGGDSCFIDLRGPASEPRNYEAIRTILKDLGYSIRPGMKFLGGMTQISVAWSAAIRSIREAMLPPPAPVFEVLAPAPEPLALPAPQENGGETLPMAPITFGVSGIGSQGTLTVNANGMLNSCITISNHRPPEYELGDEE